jgi:hypothetical protein
VVPIRRSTSTVASFAPAAFGSVNTRSTRSGAVLYVAEDSTGAAVGASIASS